MEPTVVLGVRWKRIGWFYGGACCCATLCSLGYTDDATRARNLNALAMFSPLAAAAITQVCFKEPVLEALGARLDGLLSRWWLLAAVTPAAIVSLSLAASLLVPGVHLTDEKLVELAISQGAGDAAVDQLRTLLAKPVVFSLMTVGQGLIVGIPANVLPAFGEEAGWRGWLLRELAPLGFWPACLLAGVMWGIWHVPMVLLGLTYPQHPRLGVVMMTTFCALLSPIMALIRLKAKTTWAAAVFHAVVNAVTPNFFLWLDGGSDLTMGFTGLPGLMILAAVNMAIFMLSDTNAVIKQIKAKVA